MLIETDSARSMLYSALAALPGPALERMRAVSACKVKVLEAAKMVTGNAIHQHGGMGMTIEYPVGHYYRRVLVAERLFGDADYHLRRFVALEPREQTR
jgi:acyl-CoA dehydrogenase